MFESVNIFRDFHFIAPLSEVKMDPEINPASSKDPGPEGPALGCPWKGLYPQIIEEPENSETRRTWMSLRSDIFHIFRLSRRRKPYSEF
jgi:hypothetical protein